MKRYSEGGGDQLNILPCKYGQMSREWVVEEVLCKEEEEAEKDVEDVEKETSRRLEEVVEEQDGEQVV